ncbi:MAG: putative Rossmann fold flavoprotein [Flavobacteriales bacterium]|jgi:predicted Rossmann fold flavoprotein
MSTLDPTERTNTTPQIAVIGGGAAGYFAAIAAAESSPSAVVTIYERANRVLQKVKVSGGGRCNVTHSCFDPAQLATHYPRGARELRGAFHRFQPTDTVAWFEARGVRLKTEADGRMFPVTDDSQTIIDCLTEAANRAGVRLRKGVGVRRIVTQDDGRLQLSMTDDSTVTCEAACLAVGSLRASPLLASLTALGHKIEPLAPSLFACNVADKRTHGLSGLAVPEASVRLLPKGSTHRGPILITHRGVSGPAILRLSAWEARAFQAEKYHVRIAINWLGEMKEEQLRGELATLRSERPKATVAAQGLGVVPRRLWRRLVTAAEIADETPWAQLSKKHERRLADQLLRGEFAVQGKTTNKDEFVTCGGVRLKEVDFRTMQSRRVPALYFAGECLDVDGITGGFNFQAAWTGGHIAGNAMADAIGRAGTEAVAGTLAE